MRPKSFALLHFNVYFSFLKAVEAPSVSTTFSSMKTSLIRLLMICEPTGAYDRDHRTTPDVVIISKASNIFVIVQFPAQFTGAISIDVLSCQKFGGRSIHLASLRWRGASRPIAAAAAVAAHGPRS